MLRNERLSVLVFSAPNITWVKAHFMCAQADWPRHGASKERSTEWCTEYSSRYDDQGENLGWRCFCSMAVTLGARLQPRPRARAN